MHSRMLLRNTRVFSVLGCRGHRCGLSDATVCCLQFQHLCFAFAVLLFSLSLVVAEETQRFNSDEAAMIQMFGDDMLQENAAEVVRQTQTFPPEQRYQELCRWVFPSEGHGFRIGGSLGRPAGESADVAEPNATELSEYPESRWIHCPARDLLAVADQLNRLESVKHLVSAFIAEDNEQRLAQETLLTLVEIAESDRDQVAERLAERFGKARNWRDSDAAEQWWTDLLVLWAASENPRTADLVIEDLFGAMQIS